MCDRRQSKGLCTLVLGSTLLNLLMPYISTLNLGFVISLPTYFSSVLSLETFLNVPTVGMKSKQISIGLLAKVSYTRNASCGRITSQEEWCFPGGGKWNCHHRMNELCSFSFVTWRIIKIDG